ncbi:MAG: gamma-glutamyltransferase [Acidobacteria bacterium]|jgi:gamma-glutamyltranspeptidase / glutathione hydrolase|nr:gamma-glutamyltransferase [Acidobacteriota bacterium]
MKTSVVCLLALAISLTWSALPVGPATAAQTPDLGVSAKDGVVVSASDIASDIGAAVLTRGGTAVDAAVATAFAMAVTYPMAGNIGGGGFMIVRTPDGAATTFDYREKAPGRSTPTMYLDDKGAINRRLTAAGYLAPGVPGTVRGLALAHSRFGKLPWQDVVMPAANLARKGFTVSDSLARGLNSQVAGSMKEFKGSVAAYGKPDGTPWKAGDRIVLGDLAKTLTAIATDGPDAFYTGWIADLIDKDMAANGGLITKADLAAYQAKERAAVRGTFLGYDIISMPPPSSGGTALIEMLNMLEALEVQKLPRLSTEAIHLTTEVRRRAFLDRARFLGDADFVDVPVATLISKPHAVEQIASFNKAAASSSVELGKDIVSMPAAEPDETTHFSVVDRNGMAVSNTYTLEGGYGSHLVVPGTGFLLNNEMGDFNKNPGTTNLTGDIGTPANLIAPGKRMLSSMTPVIVARSGKLVLVTGTPGGRTIINTSLDVVLGVTAWGLTGREAVDAPRMHHQWLPDRLSIEGDGVSAATLEALKALGHDVRMGGRQGSAQTVWVHPNTGVYYGVVDMRSPDAKASRRE